MGAESGIRDAFTNLVINAVDAMPRFGISEAVRLRCLEPFFTTVLTPDGHQVTAADGGPAARARHVPLVGVVWHRSQRSPTRRIRRRCYHPRSFSTSPGCV
jgi:hypothetical protein